LTIKLTQHVSIPRGTKSLSCLRRTLLQSFVGCFRVRRVKASSPFHNTLLEQILRFTPSTPPSDTSACRAEGVNCQLPSVVKEPSCRQLPGTSPRLAERKTGLEPVSREIKNPASSAG